MVMLSPYRGQCRSRSKPRRHPGLYRWLPRLEQLPDRIAPACTAGFSAPTLTVNCDSKPDTISITRDGFGFLYFNGSLIRGATVSNTTKIVVDAGLGDDTVTIAGNIAIATTVNAGAGNDLVTGGAGKDTVSGGDGDDSVFGGVGDDLLNGQNGNDQLFGQGNNDAVNGGNNNDLVQGDQGNDTTDGGLGTDTLLEVGDVDYTLANFSLVGEGTDVLDNLELVNLVGGAGNNIFTVSGFTLTAILDGAGGTDRVISSNNANFTLSNTNLVRSTGGTFTLAAIEQANLTGGSSSNILDATAFTAGAVTLDGGLGNDTLKGGAASDILIGGDGNDSMTGGDGNDTLSGGLGVDLLQGDAGSDSLTGGDGDDNLQGGFGNDTVNGDAGTDILLGGADADLLSGGLGTDSLQGDAGSDTLLGGDGNDTLLGGTEGDSIQGETGGDSVAGGDGSDTVSGGADTDTIAGDLGVDRLFEQGDVNFNLTSNALTGLGSDALSGIEEAHLVGGVGANAFTVAFPGAATMDGGAGIDTIIESADANFVLTDGKLTGIGTHVLISIEQANITGGASANTIDASAFSGSATLVGSAGNDSLIGGKAADSVLGGDGDDTLKGGPGDDTLDGGLGTDRHADPGVGNDTLISIEETIVTGTPGNDVIDMSGNTSGVVIDGGGGADTIIGGSGNDTILSGSGNDSINGGGGTDMVVASGDVNFTLTDTSLTGAGNDVLVSIELAQLTGGPSGNSFNVSGFTGSGTMIGGGGVDTVISSVDADFTLTDLPPTISGGLRGTRAAGDQSRALLTVSTGGSFTLVDTLNVHLTGGGGKNSFTIDNFSGQAKLDGGAGEDKVAVKSTTSMTLTDAGVTRADGRKVDFTSVEEASLAGGAGNEVLDASQFTLGSVTLDGAAGKDTLIGSAQGDSLVGSDGADELRGRDGIDTLIGGSGRDILKGGKGADSVIAGAGNDLLVGGGDDDFLDGSEGFDTVNGSGGEDLCRRGEVLLNCP